MEATRVGGYLPSEMVLGLTGYARTGKDSVATILADYGFWRVAFADGVRECLEALDPQVSHAGCASRLKYWLNHYGGWDVAKVEVPELRTLQQKMGTEVGRNIIGQTTWIDVAMAKAAGHRRVVISDVRFPDEADAVRAAGGRVWRIVRPEVGPQSNHASETSMEDYQCDATVRNDGDLTYLRGVVLQTLGVPTYGAHPTREPTEHELTLMRGLTYHGEQEEVDNVAAGHSLARETCDVLDFMHGEPE